MKAFMGEERRDRMNFQGLWGRRILVSMTHLEEEKFWFLWLTSGNKRG
jgi:hypothetical protein